MKTNRQTQQFRPLLDAQDETIPFFFEPGVNVLDFLWGEILALDEVFRHFSYVGVVDFDVLKNVSGMQKNFILKILHWPKWQIHGVLS